MRTDLFKDLYQASIDEIKAIEELSIDHNMLDSGYYLWWKDEKGIHFEDRLYSAGIFDDWKDKDELRLDFKNLDEAIEWIKRKEGKLNE